MGSAEPTSTMPSPYDTLRDNAPQRSKLLGTWQYKAASLEYLGDNPLAEVALAQIEVMGTSEYYSMDPFHEGANTRGIDVPAAYTAIANAMYAANEDIDYDDCELLEDDPDYFECPNCDDECEKRTDADGEEYWWCDSCCMAFDEDGEEIWPDDEEEEE